MSPPARPLDVPSAQDVGASADADRAAHEPGGANVVIEGLRKARALVERGWCQGRMSTANGSVCIRGAILNSFEIDEYVEDRQADELLRAATGFHGYLGDWNDAPERTQAEVLAAFDRAIELAEKSA